MYSDDNSSLWNIHYGKFCCKVRKLVKGKKENCYHERRNEGVGCTGRGDAGIL